jgi:hypothetical protein
MRAVLGSAALLVLGLGMVGCAANVNAAAPAASMGSGASESATPAPEASTSEASKPQQDSKCGALDSYAKAHEAPAFTIDLVDPSTFAIPPQSGITVTPTCVFHETQPQNITVDYAYWLVGQDKAKALFASAVSSFTAAGWQADRTVLFSGRFTGPDGLASSVLIENGTDWGGYVKLSK